MSTRDARLLVCLSPRALPQPYTTSAHTHKHKHDRQIHTKTRLQPATAAFPGEQSSWVVSSPGGVHAWDPGQAPSHRCHCIHMYAGA